MTVVLLGANHVLEHGILESLAKVADEATRPEIPWCASRPEVIYEVLVSTTEDGIFIGLVLVNPCIRMLVEEHGQVWDMTETLKSRIQITCVSDICETDLAFGRRGVCHL